MHYFKQKAREYIVEQEHDEIKHHTAQMLLKELRMTVDDILPAASHLPGRGESTAQNTSIQKKPVSVVRNEVQISQFRR